MDFLDAFIFSLDNMLDTKRKRHIIGGHAAERVGAVRRIGCNCLYDQK